MQPGSGQPHPESLVAEPIEELGRVSPHFLSELFRALARHAISPARLLGDLPIVVDEHGRVMHPVPWDHVCDFLRRLEHQLGSAEALEACGEWMCASRRMRSFRGLVALATSPASLYRAGAGALRHAIPGLEVEIGFRESKHFALEIRIAEPLRACPQLLHLSTGAARALPRLLDMPDSVVSAKVEDRHARYEITIPASRTAIARIRRAMRAILSPGSVLRYLEDKQHELLARFASLSRAHESLLASERRLRDLSDAAVDMLCEIDAGGRIVFVSASVRELMGYSPDQVAGSHYRLWVPTRYHAAARERFEALRRAPLGTAFVKQTVELHAAHGQRVFAEVSIRAHRTVEGEWRAAAVLRDVTRRNAASLDRLRAGAAALRARPTGHPLERSLPQLVALLEAFESGDPARAGSGRTFEATQRMTRIVEHALLRDQDGEQTSEWIETRKLVDRVRDAHGSRWEAGEPTLRVDLSRAPAELWGREGLLDACIAGLVDWARGRARARAGGETTGAALLALSIERARDDGEGGPAVEIAMTVEAAVAAAADRAGTPAATRDARARRATADPGARDGELALAVAEDAARALGGELVLPAAGAAGGTGAADGGAARTIRLPQPSAEAQSGTRSMSAPSARSFSSTRS